MSILDKKDWGERKSGLRVQAGYRDFRFPTGTLSGSTIRYANVDVKFWDCISHTYPRSKAGSGQNSGTITYQNVAYVYTREGEAYFASTASGRIFTVNYVNPDNMWLQNRSNGDGYYNSSNPNYQRPGGGWISTVSLQCMKGDDTCQSGFKNGTPVVYWPAGNHMELVQMRQGASGLEVVYEKVPGSHEDPLPPCKTWRNPNTGDRPGDIYRYANPYQGNRNEYFRLKKVPYWYFPTNGTSNADWEYLGITPACIQN